MAGGYDELMNELERLKSWGVLTIKLQDGKPTLITLQETYKSVADAIKKKSATE